MLIFSVSKKTGKVKISHNLPVKKDFSTTPDQQKPEKEKKSTEAETAADSSSRK